MENVALLGLLCGFPLIAFVVVLGLAFLLGVLVRQPSGGAWVGLVGGAFGGLLTFALVLVLALFGRL